MKSTKSLPNHWRRDHVNVANIQAVLLHDSMKDFTRLLRIYSNGCHLIIPDKLVVTLWNSPFE
jgi:hypothetical protein